MQEVEGKEIVDKYVKKTAPQKREIHHVGGAFPKTNDPTDNYGKQNKLGVDSTRDY